MTRHASNSRSRAMARRRRERGGIVLRVMKYVACAVLLVILWLIHEPLLRLAGRAWVVDDLEVEADAILVLGDDNYAAQRVSRAAELYHDRRAPIVVASGRYLRPYLSVPDLMQRDLQERGVPPAAIVRAAGFVMNTREEAVMLRGLVQQRGWKRVIVVTSNFHTRRAAWIFERVFRGVAQVTMVASRDAAYDPARWWQTRSGVKVLSSELMGFPVAMWETRSDKAALRPPVDSREPPRPAPLLAPAPAR